MKQKVTKTFHYFARVDCAISQIINYVFKFNELGSRTSKDLMPCPFTGRKIFCTSPSFLSQPKNLTAFSATSKTFGAAQKPILLNENHLFVWHKIFVTATICK